VVSGMLLPYEKNGASTLYGMKAYQGLVLGTPEGVP